MTHLQDRRRLQHLRHECGYALQLAITSPNSSEDAVKYRQLGLVGWHKASDLSHERNYSNLPLLALLVMPNNAERTSRM